MQSKLQLSPFREPGAGASRRSSTSRRNLQHQNHMRGYAHRMQYVFTLQYRFWNSEYSSIWILSQHWMFERASLSVGWHSICKASFQMNTLSTRFMLSCKTAERPPLTLSMSVLDRRRPRCNSMSHYRTHISQLRRKFESRINRNPKSLAICVVWHILNVLVAF